MGVHNELKNSPLPRALKKILGVTDAESGLERFGETLTPVLDVWSLPEFQYPRGERGFSENVTSPAVAARFSCIALGNPAGSNLIGVVTLLRNQAASIAVDLDTGTFAAIGANIVAQAARPLDFRPFQPGSSAVPQSQLLLQIGDTAGGGTRNNYVLAPAPANAPLDNVDPQIMIVPATVLLLFSLIVNTQISADLRWRERRVTQADELV